MVEENFHVFSIISCYVFSTVFITCKNYFSFITRTLTFIYIYIYIYIYITSMCASVFFTYDLFFFVSFILIFSIFFIISFLSSRYFFLFISLLLGRFFLCLMVFSFFFFLSFTFTFTFFFCFFFLFCGSPSVLFLPILFVCFFLSFYFLSVGHSCQAIISFSCFSFC